MLVSLVTPYAFRSWNFICSHHDLSCHPFKNRTSITDWSPQWGLSPILLLPVRKFDILLPVLLRRFSVIPLNSKQTLHPLRSLSSYRQGRSLLDVAAFTGWQYPQRCYRSLQLATDGTGANWSGMNCQFWRTRSENILKSEGLWNVCWETSNPRLI